MNNISQRPGAVGGENLDASVIPADLFEMNDSTKVLGLRDGWTFAGSSSDGKSIVIASVYKQSATAPATPTGGSFNFNTGTLTAPSGWSVNQPTATTTPVYRAEYTFIGLSLTDVITATTWSTPVVYAVAGSDGYLATYSNVDGGHSGTVYGTDQVIDGGSANG